MKFEEEILLNKLSEYQELSTEWRVIKMALEGRSLQSMNHNEYTSCIESMLAVMTPLKKLK